MDSTSRAAPLIAWPSRHTSELEIHTSAPQSLLRLHCLDTFGNQRFGLEYTAIPFPIERGCWIWKALWLHRQSSGHRLGRSCPFLLLNPQPGCWKVTGKWAALLNSSIVSPPQVLGRKVEEVTSTVADSILAYPEQASSVLPHPHLWVHSHLQRTPRPPFKWAQNVLKLLWTIYLPWTYWVLTSQGKRLVTKCTSGSLWPNALLSSGTKPDQPSKLPV